MFNTNSDYAINKLDPDAIVCRSVSGEVVRITREVFASDEEFEIWKSWSDADYHQSECCDRAYNDRRAEIVSAWCVEAKDTDWLALELQAIQHGQRTKLIDNMRGFLTDVQFKRLWQRFAEGRELADIAADDGVSVTAVASSIERAIKRLKKLIHRGLLY